MASPDPEFVILDDQDVEGTDSSGLQPLIAKDLQEICNWLKPTDYAAESGEYGRHLKSYVEGTDLWMQATQFEDWSQSQKHGTLWFRAIPGAGKSVVAARLIQHIQTEVKAPVIFFFFRQIITSNQTPSDLLRDWLAQVLMRSPYLQTELKVHLDSGREYTSIAFEELWQLLIKALCTLPRVYCVVDALDEMSYGNDDFLAQLVNLGEIRPGTLKVCITSRPVHRIEKILTADSVRTFTLEPALLQPAVAKYIDFRLDTLNLVAVNDKAEIKRQLLERSTGLFLYVKLMMDELIQKAADSTSLVFQAKQLPNGLGAMYSHMLQIHSIRNDIPQSLQIAILRWVTHSARPLRVLELAAIIDSLIATQLLPGIESIRAHYPNTKAMIRVACGSLIVIFEDETVGIIHHSLTEYIVDSSRSDSTSIECANSFPTIDSASSHREMAITCLRYLCIGWANGDLLKAGDEKPRRKKSNTTPNYAKYPFLRYASDHWAHHTRHVSWHDLELFQMIDEFVDPSSGYLEAWYGCRDKGRHPYIQDEDVEKSVAHCAAREGLATYIDYLVQQGHKIDITNVSGNTPLHLAAENGHSAAVSVLLQHGAKPDEANDHGLKPLHVAASRNHADALRLLLEAGVDPMTKKTREYPGRRCGNARSSVGDTPVYYAFTYGHKHAAMTLAPYLTSDDLLQATHWAAEAGKSDILISIINDYHVEVDKLVNGKSLYYLSAYNHDIEALEKLASLGARSDILCNGVFNEHGMRCISYIDEIQLPPLYAFARGCQIGSANNARVRKQKRRVLELLLQSGGDINFTNAHGNSLLLIALGGQRWEKAANPDIIEALLEKGADPCLANNSGEQPLHTTGLEESIIRALVKYGADVNARIATSGKTPLHCCFEAFNNDHFATLLELGADCNAQDNEGNTPLHIALQKSCSTGPDKIKALLEKGANPIISNKKRETPLHVMRKPVTFKQPTVNISDYLHMLLQSGADLEAKTLEGKTVLMMLTDDWLKYSPDDLATFLEAGANLEARDHQGCSLYLQLCQQRDNLPRLLGLAERNANTHATDFMGNNAFHHFARHKPYHSDIQLLRTMVQSGIECDKTNYLGQSPIHIAAGTQPEGYSRDGVDAMIFLLEDCKADINATDHSGLRPIHYAATLSSLRVQEMIERGADMCAATYDDQTILHIACRARESNTVGLICDKLGARTESFINSVDQRGRTALHYACRSGRVESVGILLNAGADVNIADKNGLTPVDACAEFEEENRLWSPGATSDIKARFIDAAGMCLDDVRRPRNSHVHPTQGLRKPKFDVSSDDESLGIRPIIRLLMTHGADISTPDPASYPRWWRLAPPSNKHLDYAVALDCGVLLDELLDRVKSHAEDKEVGKEHAKSATPMSARVYAEQWLTSRFREPQSPIDQVTEGNQEALVATFLRNEDEKRLLQYRDHGGDIIGPGAGILRTLIQYGYANMLSLLKPTASEFKNNLRHAKPDPRYPMKSPISTACARALPNLEVLKVLVTELGYNVNEGEKGGLYCKEQAPLHVLASSSLWWKSHGIALLVKHGANVNIRDTDGKTPLWHAVHDKATENIRMLLRCGADPNIAATDGTTCLNKSKTAKICHLLLDHGANPADGKYPFIYDAIDLMDYDLVARVVQCGFDLNKPLLLARRERFGNYDAPLSRLYSLKQREDDRLFPIHLAASAHYNTPENRPRMIPIITLLLQHGADPLESHRPGRSILHALCNQQGIIEPFMGKYNVETQDELGNTLLLSACAQPDDRWIDSKSEGLPPCNIGILLAQGADAKVKNHQNQNALHILFSRVFARGYTFLLERDFDTLRSYGSANSLVHQVDDSGHTPLILAIKNKHLYAIRDLLAMGAEPLTTDPEGNTPLHHISPCTCSHELNPNPHPDLATSTIQLFLSLGMSIDARNKFGQTPLHIAFQCANKLTPAALNFFLAAGADPKARDNEGKNLLHYIASTPRRSDVYSYLEDGDRDKVEDEVWSLLTQKGGCAELDPNEEDVMQRSCWDLASASGNQRVLGRVKRSD